MGDKQRGCTFCALRRLSMTNMKIPSKRTLKDLPLLIEVISKQQPELIPLLDILGWRLLDNNERDSLREAVLDEFVETGLREDDEPNSRGLQLESLIELLGQL